MSDDHDNIYYGVFSSENLTVSLPDSEVPPIIRADDVTCMWNGGEIARMEWLFLNETIIVPMEYTNMSWNNEKFTCMQMSTEPINVTVKGKRNYFVFVHMYEMGTH